MATQWTFGDTFVSALTQGLERKQRQKQFEAELAVTQRANEALAQYRLQSLAQMAAQAKMTYDSAAADREALNDYREASLRQQRDEFEADLVDGRTSRAAELIDSRERRIGEFEFGGQTFRGVAPEDALEAIVRHQQMQSNERVATINSSDGVSGRYRPENIDLSGMSDEELADYIARLGEERRPVTNFMTGDRSEQLPSSLYPAYARALQEQLARQYKRKQEPPPPAPPAPLPYPVAPDSMFTPRQLPPERRLFEGGRPSMPERGSFYNRRDTF